MLDPAPKFFFSHGLVDNKKSKNNMKTDYSVKLCSVIEWTASFFLKNNNSVNVSYSEINRTYPHYELKYGQVINLFT